MPRDEHQFTLDFHRGRILGQFPVYFGYIGMAKTVQAVVCPEAQFLFYLPESIRKIIAPVLLRSLPGPANGGRGKEVELGVLAQRDQAVVASRISGISFILTGLFLAFTYILRSVRSKSFTFKRHTSMGRKKP